MGHPLDSFHIGQLSDAPKTKGAFVGTIYRKDRTNPHGDQARSGKRWLGKLGSPDEDSVSAEYRSISKMRRGIDRNAAKEKIANDLYLALACALDEAYQVPKTRLAYLPIINEYTADNDLAQAMRQGMNNQRGAEVNDAVHVMSKWMEGYQDLKEAQVSTPEGSQGYMDHLKASGSFADTILVEGHSIPLNGLMELLASARLLGDIDVLGNVGTNAGFVITRDAQNQPMAAQMVKVDPGMAMTFDGAQNRVYATQYPPRNPAARRQQRPLADVRNLQIGTMANEILWSSLSAAQHARFIRALNVGAGLLETPGLLDYLMQRGGELVQSPRNESLMKPELVSEHQENLAHNVTLQAELYQTELEAASKVAPSPFLQTALRLMVSAEGRLASTQNVLSTTQEELARSQGQLAAAQGSEQSSKQQLREVKLELAVSRGQVEALQEASVDKDAALERSQAQFAALQESEQSSKQQMQEVASENAAIRAQLDEYQAAPPVHHPPQRAGRRLPAAEEKDVESAADAHPQLQAFLQHIAYGEQDEAEGLLKRSPELVHGHGDVTDYSDRTFRHITGFQYAVWALDWHMWTMLLKYLPAPQAAEQLRRWNASPQHGQVHRFEPLLEAYQTYLDQYDGLYKAMNWGRLEALWIRGVGKAQQQSPAHVLLEYTTKEGPLHPTPDFTKPGRPAPHDKCHVKWVFEAEYNGGKIATGWGLSRGNRGVGWGWDRLMGDRPPPMFLRNTVDVVLSDAAALKMLSNTRKAQWTSLREQLLAPQRDAGLGAHA